MSTSDELRRMLDECGIEWKTKRGRKHDGTEWHDRFGTHVEAVQEYTWDGTEQPDGKLRIERGASYLTPAQAIAATLGRGKCHNAAPSYLDFLCSECGFVHYHSDENDSGDGNEWRFCPKCGAEVVDE